MDKDKALYTINGLKTVYDEYSQAFQLAVDILNGTITIFDSQLEATRIELKTATDKIVVLEKQITDAGLPLPIDVSADNIKP